MSTPRRVTILRKLQVREISLVDNPANPAARIAIIKRAAGAAPEARLAELQADVEALEKRLAKSEQATDLAKRELAVIEVRKMAAGEAMRRLEADPLLALDYRRATQRQPLEPEPVEKAAAPSERTRRLRELLQVHNRDTPQERRRRRRMPGFAHLSPQQTQRGLAVADEPDEIELAVAALRQALERGQMERALELAADPRVLGLYSAWVAGDLPVRGLEHLQ